MRARLIASRRSSLFWHRQSKDLGAKLDAICGKIKNDASPSCATGGSAPSAAARPSSR
jgi:hypothetical protein